LVLYLISFVCSTVINIDDGSLFCERIQRVLMRIHIIGGPGSGKTTLARRIAARFYIP
jgi:hypothetical protein